ncbi:MAG: glycosyltransferase [Roseburia sp.]|nr:glycosyltransferase [Roseburia sp.]MCM1201638.1 glycosyltransferase [Bacteroides fragilis]
MPKVSVIVPVCNVEQYLPACLDSILAQTLEDIEVICVDDGSTDRSPAILDGYAGKDSRLRVFHKENSGYGHSMNIGIDTASGEYIGIVESDDRILPDMYEKLYSAAKENDLDLVKSDVVFWWENLQYTCEYHREDLNEYYGKVLDSSDRKLFFRFFMNTWTGIYKRSFLKENAIRHNETPGAAYQDNGFWIQTLSFCKRAMWLKDAFYLYRQDNPLASVKKKSNVMTMAKEYDFAEKILEKKKKRYELDICRYYRVFRHRGVFLRIADDLKRGYCDTIIRDFEKYGELASENKDLYEWLEKVCADPDGFCETFIRAKRETQQKLEGAGHIIIYGAGLLGQAAMRILACQGLQGKLLCFAVSAGKTAESVGNLSVRCIDELARYSRDSVVVMGVRDRSGSYFQMKEQLERLGFADTVDLSRLTNYFYYIY